jgi:enoyl-CoA hydratase/carnithine racemase
MTQPPQQPEIPPPSLDDVLYEARDGYAIITLNRPVVLNAIDWSIRRRLGAALDQFDADDSAKAAILTGAGRAFSSGGDIQSGPPPEDGEATPDGLELCLRIWRSPKPIIAAVRGYAVGQGHELAGVCDMTIAAEDAVFGELQIRHGFGPPTLITPYLASPKFAKEMLLLGERISAADAQRLGLVNRIVPADQLMEVAKETARKIAALNPVTVQTNKLLVNRVHEIAGFNEALHYREDPVIQAMGSAERSAHLDVLREKGWEAFRQSRDEVYGETEAAGPGTD